MQEIRELFKTGVKEAFGVEIDFDLSIPEEKFGDFSSNIALILAKKLNLKPHQVAEKIIETLPNNSIIKKKSILLAQGLSTLL